MACTLRAFRSVIRSRMIWFISGILVWLTLLYTLTPLLSRGQSTTDNQSDRQTYLEEIARIDAELAVREDPDLQAQKIDFQRKLLATARKQDLDTSPVSGMVLNSIFLLMTFGAIGIYAVIGSPELSSRAGVAKAMADAGAITSPAARDQDDSRASLEELVRKLAVTVQDENPNDPTGWTLLARSLMQLERFDDAFVAYERVLDLTDNDPDVVREYESAKRYAEQVLSGASPTQPRGPTAADIEAAASLTDEERQAMVESMVESLASRLADDPDNPSGWVRLLRARKVLEQNDALAADIQKLRVHYAEQPNVVEQILRDAGVESP